MGNTSWAGSPGFVNVRGEILSAVAHEVHQPLFAIKNFALAAKSLLLGSATISGAIELLDEIALQAERGSEIGRRLREFARHADIEREALNLHDAIRGCRGIAELHARQHGVDLDFRLKAEHDLISGDALQLQHVLLNLIKNGCEALSQTPVAKRRLIISTVNECGEIVVRVEDNGPGIEAAIAERLFEPYCSSKSSGMGIGLAFCRTIIIAHQGRIWHEPSGLGGTAFVIALESIV